MYGIMKLQGGGPPGSGPPGAEKHAGYKGYKTGSRKGTAAGDKGDKKSQKRTARELDELIIGGDVTRGGKAFLSGKISAAERRQQLMDLANRARGKGIPFALNPEEFTGNLRGLSNAAKIGKLREGMSGADYHNYMRGLYDANPAAMETAFPWGSGARLRGLANLVVPAPLKLLGSIAGGAKQALGKAFPGPAKDLSFEYDKFKKNFENIGPNIKRNVKTMLGLTPTEEANLNILNKEMNPKQQSVQEMLQAENDEWTDQILGDVINEAETQSIGDFENKIAYDPTQDVDTRTSGPYEVEEDIFDPSAEDEFYKDSWGVTRDQYNKIMDPSPLTREQVDKGLWSQAEGYDDKWLEDALGYPVYKSMSGRFFKVNPETGYVQMNEDITDDVTKLSMSMRTDRPVSMNKKKDFINQTMGWDASRMDEDSEFYDPEYINQTYNRLKKKTDQGWEYGPFEGVINKPNVGLGEHGYRDKRWQYPGTDELVDQIEWNTANRPLDWSGGETPELTEDFIKENITTDWDFNQAGYLKKYDDGG